MVKKAVKRKKETTTDKKRIDWKRGSGRKQLFQDILFLRKKRGKHRREMCKTFFWKKREWEAAKTEQYTKKKREKQKRRKETTKKRHSNKWKVQTI